MSLAIAPQHGGIITTLLALCEKVTKQYRRELVPDGWDWKPKHEIIKLIVRAGGYFPVNLKEGYSILYSTLPREDQFVGDYSSDSDEEHHARYDHVIAQNKRRKVAYDFLARFPPMLPIRSITAASSSPALSPLSLECFATPSPFMGG